MTNHLSPLTDLAPLIAQARDTDILALAQTATRLKRVGRSLKRGDEWAGPCPRGCGAKTDGFKVFPTVGKWFCRNCTGDTDFRDVIDLQAFLTTGNARPSGREFVEAVQALVGAPTNLSRSERRPIVALPNDDGPPSPQWQATGRRLVERAEACLWSPAGEAFRRYLLDERRLTETTLRQNRLGCIPADYHMPLAAWGLPPSPEGKDVWLPAGIVLPTFMGEELWGVHVRRYAPLTGWAVKGRKLPFITGSRKALWGAANTDRRVLFLCGGELDAALVQQEAVVYGGACSFTTGEGSRLSPFFSQLLLSADVILVLYDADRAGQEGAWRQVFLHTARAVMCPPPQLRPGDKDVTDFARAGGAVAAWLAGLRQQYVRNDPEQLAMRLSTFEPVRMTRRQFYLDLQLDYAQVSGGRPKR